MEQRPNSDYASGNRLDLRGDEMRLEPVSSYSSVTVICHLQQTSHHYFPIWCWGHPEVQEKRAEPNGPASSSLMWRLQIGN